MRFVCLVLLLLWPAFCLTQSIEVVTTPPEGIAVNQDQAPASAETLSRPLQGEDDEQAASVVPDYQTYEAVDPPDQEIPAPALTKDSRNYLSAIVISQKLNLSVYYSPVSRVVVIKNDSVTAKLIVDQKDAIIDGELLSVKSPVVLWRNEVYIPVEILTGIFQVALSDIEPFLAQAGSESKPESIPAAVSEAIETPPAQDTPDTAFEQQPPVAELDRESTAEIVLKTLQSLKPASDNSLPSVPAIRKFLLFIDDEQLKAQAPALREHFRALASDFCSVTSEISTVEIIKNCNPTDINRSACAALVVLTPAFMKNHGFQVISAFVGKNLLSPSDPQSASALLDRIRRPLTELGAYSGSVFTAFARLGCNLYLNKPSICFEVLNLTNPSDLELISQADFRRAIASALRHSAEGLF